MAPINPHAAPPVEHYYQRIAAFLQAGANPGNHLIVSPMWLDVAETKSVYDELVRMLMYLRLELGE